ncbi:MAG: hypothetical protein KC543_14355 [Myxococcales bacterium]|nr:hypothetical protein [Myxococcales bacterium]
MTDQTTALPPRIYQHSARKEWGRAVLVLEQADRLTFLFEDGTERRFHVDYIDRMQAIDVEPDEAARIDKQARRNQPPSSGSRKGRAARPRKPPVSFEQQLAHFLKLFPGGFEDRDYIKTERGNPGTKAAAQCKDAAIARAAELLGEDALTAQIAAGEFEAIRESVGTILTATKNTTNKTEGRAFGRSDAAASEEFAKALLAALYGQGPYTTRFNHLVAAMHAPDRPSWPLATLIPALIAPDEHVFVKPTILKKQTLVFDIDPRYDTKPNGVTYTQFQHAAKVARRRLDAAGQKPRDLLDVYAFMAKTLSPKALKKLAP